MNLRIVAQFNTIESSYLISGVLYPPHFSPSSAIAIQFSYKKVRIELVCLNSFIWLLSNVTTIRKLVFDWSCLHFMQKIYCEDLTFIYCFIASSYTSQPSRIVVAVWKGQNKLQLPHRKLSSLPFLSLAFPICSPPSIQFFSHIRREIIR